MKGWKRYAVIGCGGLIVLTVLCGIIGSFLPDTQTGTAQASLAASAIDAAASAAPVAAVVVPTTEPTITAIPPTEIPASPPAPTNLTMAENLAIIEGYPKNNDKITQIDTMLTQLDAAYTEDKQKIGDMTAASFDQIKKAGGKPSIVTIMEDMLEVAEAQAGISYTDAIVTYTLIKVKQ